MGAFAGYERGGEMERARQTGARLGRDVAAFADPDSLALSAGSEGSPVFTDRFSYAAPPCRICTTASAGLAAGSRFDGWSFPCLRRCPAKSSRLICARFYTIPIRLTLKQGEQQDV